MCTTPLQYRPTLTEETLDLVAKELSQHGFIVLKSALSAELVRHLLTIAAAHVTQFQPAGIGREKKHHLNNTIRTDKIRWMDPSNITESAYLGEMETLRKAMNKRLFMGLFDYEANFAHYPPGAFYKKHLDAFKGQTNRVLTTVFYLNENWDETDGGDLVVYNLDNQIIRHIKPDAGTLVIFLSDEFPHEVSKVFKDRYSIAGWFRINNSSAYRVDPAS
ncbi:2OG-Fe(II) oxygenase [Neptunomonas antarctica]|uniref:SM-20-related protein n=1 Tax=Neptunomonas antarctica TaxID=619304 RepID=A0A1N7N9B0_9GAMM|nr:2OG-Fe(II) oxygenase [Neptunomonas antarctica]SIS94963.1 SM-20-related protein [Neptunomonas antarctica]